MVLFLISGTHFVFAHCDNLKAEASFSINEDDEAYIYARASVSNLTYWPFMVFGRAYISSDHSVVCYHYYEDEKETFTVYWAYRLVVDEDARYQANPRYGPRLLTEFDPKTQAMPKSLDESETLWVDVNDLPAGPNGRHYHMTAYTRIDADFTDEGFKDRFSWKDCKNSVRFLHRRPPGPPW